jgi:hypothetical protein
MKGSTRVSSVFVEWIFPPHQVIQILDDLVRLLIVMESLKDEHIHFEVILSTRSETSLYVRTFSVTKMVIYGLIGHPIGPPISGLPEERSAR